MPPHFPRHPIIPGTLSRPLFAGIALALTLIAQATFAAEPPATNRLSLDSPLDFQVFQRQRPDRGTIIVSGQVPADTRGLEIRVLRSLAGNREELANRRIRVKPGTPTFEASLRLPAGGWYRCEVSAFAADSDSPSATVTVDHVGVGEVFVVAGQSNSANHGSERQEPVSDKVSAFDGKQWRPARDPQPGASGSAGSFVPAFGDALVARFGVPVGVVSIGVGATSVREWLPRGDRMTNQPTTGANVKAVGPHTWEATGTLFDRLSNRLQGLGRRGCRAVLWHQGESDAGQARSGYPADRQITGDQYVAFMRRLVEASRKEAGWKIPWVTAQATYHSEKDAADAEFRSAQAALWKSGLTRRGPDTDALRAEYRDGVHFNPRGLRRHGELWVEQVAGMIEP